MATIMIRLDAIGTTESFDTATMPAASHVYAVEYGLRQSLQDAYASVTKKSHPDPVARKAARRGLYDKRLAQLRSGNVPGSTYVPTAVDSVIAANGLTADDAAALIREALAARGQSSKKKSA